MASTQSKEDQRGEMQRCFYLCFQEIVYGRKYKDIWKLNWLRIHLLFKGRILKAGIINYCCLESVTRSIVIVPKAILLSEGTEGRVLP